MKKIIIFAIIALAFSGCANKQEAMETTTIKSHPHIQTNETAMEVIPIKTIPRETEE